MKLEELVRAKSGRLKQLVSARAKEHRATAARRRWQERSSTDKARRAHTQVEEQPIDEECQPEDSGWALGQTPSLQSLLRAQARRGPGAVSSEYRHALRESPAFHAPSAVGAMAAALGVTGAAEGMHGTLLLSLPNSEQAAELRRTIKDRVDLAWSNEALSRGVTEAKAGGRRRRRRRRPAAHIAQPCPRCNARCFSGALHPVLTPSPAAARRPLRGRTQVVCQGARPV